MIWTRIGEGSKIIFTGDPMQSDLKNKSVDFPDLIRKLQHIEEIGTTIFTDQEIVRHPIIAKILNAIREN